VNTEPLTATQQATLDVLSHEPATSAEVRERTGRSRSSTDKALSDLAKVGLATRAPAQDGHDGPARWVRVNVEDHDPEPAAATDTQFDATDEIISEPDGAQPATLEPSQAEFSDGPKETESDDPAGSDTTAGRDETGDAATEGTAPDVKVCRGCQNQMPVVCPCCWQRTGAYCGACRQTMPARRRGNPDEPQILSNGLPKLTSGQLEQLVSGVMREQPVPDHLGVVGWTSGRIAIFLPGRSTGAIGKVLERLVSTGKAERLCESPKLYRPTHTSQQTENESPQTSTEGGDEEPADQLTDHPAADVPTSKEEKD
jgi:hypothetical protein